MLINNILLIDCFHSSTPHSYPIVTTCLILSLSPTAGLSGFGKALMRFTKSVFSPLCTPGMAVNLWGESPLYMNPVPSFYVMVTKVLAEGKGLRLAMASQEGDIARLRPCLPTGR